jgi:hypothetical protein
VRFWRTLPCANALPWGTSNFAVRRYFAMRHHETLTWFNSLPCVPLASHGKEVFAVQCLTAMIGCTAAPDFPVVRDQITASALTLISVLNLWSITWSQLPKILATWMVL